MGKRQCQLGSGQKGNLPIIADKVTFTLDYHKRYPTFDDLASRLSDSEAVQKLTPDLASTLIELEMLPADEF